MHAMTQYVATCFHWQSIQTAIKTQAGKQLEKRAAFLLNGLGGLVDHSTDRLVKDNLRAGMNNEHNVRKSVGNLEALLRQRRALEVFVHAKLLLQLHALLVRDGRLVLLLHAGNKVGVVAEIKLGAHENDGHAGAVVAHFGIPLRTTVKYGNNAPHRRQTLDLTFSYDAELTREKQIRKTSVWGYESGRRRS